MGTIAFYFLLAAIVAIVVLLAAKISPVHPVTITIVPQLLLLSFTFTNLQHRLRPFSGLTWVVLIGCMLAFSLGAFVSSAATSNWREDPRPRHLVADPWLVLLLPFALFTVGFLWGVAHTGNIPLFSRHPEQARLIFTSNIFQGWLFSQIITIITFCLLAFDVGTSRTFKLMSVLVAVLSLSMYFATGSRGLVLMFILMLLTFLDIMVSRLKPGHILAAFLLACLIFFGGGYLRYGKSVDYASSKYAPQLAEEFIIDNAYAYSANSFWNLDYAIKKMRAEQLRVPTYGASASEGLLASLGLALPLYNGYDWDGAMNHDVVMVRGLNSTGFQWALIKDFGVWAPFFWSFAWGLVLTATDKYCRLRKPINLVLIQGQFAYYTFASFGIFPFSISVTVIGTISTAIMLVFLGPKISREPVTRMPPCPSSRP